MQRYAITNRLLLGAPPIHFEPALRTQVEQWVAAGVEWVQLREKDLPTSAIASLVGSLASLTRASRTRLLVNGLAPEHVLACGADGVHLPGSSSVEAIATAVAAAHVVSVSCHTLAEVHAARDAGATLALWAPVFGKALPGAPALPGTGLAQLSEACAQAAPMPVFALGGVTAATAADCMAAGAAGVAGIRLFHDQAWGEDWRALR